MSLASSTDRPSLWLSDDDARSLAVAQRLALLVGGYVGQRNLGDLAQAMTAVGLASEAGYQPVIVCEASLETSHRGRSLPVGLSDVPVAWLVRPGDDPGESWVPAPELVVGGPVAVHLYGGGFLVDRWIAPMGEMLTAVWEWADRLADGQAGLLVTGQQLDDRAAVDATTREVLSQARLALARDAESAALLASLVPVPARCGGDDAVITLAGITPEPAPGSLFVHVNGLEHVTDDSTSRFAVVAEVVLTWLARLGADATVRGVTAFSADVPGRLVVDEAGDQERLAGHLLEVADRLHPGADDLVAALVRGRCPRPTSVVASSYHTALLGALLGGPVLLLVENDYYRRKGRGLEALLPPGTVGVLDLETGWSVDRREELDRLLASLRPMTAAERDGLLSRHRVAADLVVAAYRQLTAEADRRAAGDFREAYLRLLADRGALQRAMHRALNDAERAHEKAEAERRRRTEAVAAAEAAFEEAAVAREESAALRAELEHILHDLDSVRSTRVVRWSAGPRRVYSRFRDRSGPA